jgi:acyl phosphate:glycerol-3-phosphate acyltransferase
VAFADRRWGPPAIVAGSYLAGSIPWTQFAARRRGVDLRRFGNGTVSGTALYRVAGFAPLAVAGSLDVAKGAVGPLVAGRRPALSAAAAAAAVSGHNWSVFLRFSGGRGVAPALGGLLASGPAGAAALLGGLVAGRLGKETAVGCFAAYVALVPITRRVHGPAAAGVAAAVVVPMVVKRLVGNRPPAVWDRRTVVSRLLLDRDSEAR